MNDSSRAETYIDAVCQRVTAGQEAVREIRTWLVDAGFGVIDFRLLWLLRDSFERQIPQIQLAALLAVSTGQISATVERLHAQALITPRAVDGDRRCQCWQLTPLGRHLLEAVVERVACLENAVRREEAA